jgi:hypothetical protein
MKIPGKISAEINTPIISAIEIRISPSPTPSFRPVMISSSAPGMAIVRKTCQRFALKLLPTSK